MTLPDDAVVKQRCLDPLHPAGALIDQRLAQPPLGTPLTHVRGRYPRLRQATLHEQGPQPARIGAIGLGPTLLAPQRARLRRLSEWFASDFAPHFAAVIRPHL